MARTESPTSSELETQSSRARSTWRWLGKHPMALFVVALAAFILWPLLNLELAASANGGRGFADLVTYPGIGRVLWNTAFLAVGSLLVAVVLGVGLAFCVTRCPRRVRPLLGLIPLLPLVVPSVANTTGWVFLLSPNAGYLNAILRQLPWWSGSTSGPVDIFSLLWIVLLTGFSLTAFVYLYVYSSMEAIGTELEAAARVSGATARRAFFTITLPLIRPALVYSSGIVLLLGIGQFTNPLLLGTARNIDVLTTVLYKATIDYPINYGLGAAVSAPLILAGLLVVVMQVRAIGEQTRYVVVTGKSSYVRARGSWFAAIPIGVFGLVAVLLPLGALVIVSLSGFWSANIDFGALTTANYERMIADPRTRDAVMTSVVATVVATAIVVPLGLAAAMMMSGSIRIGGVFRRAVDILVTLPLGMPAAIFGFAILYAYALAPFNLYGTSAIVTIAYVTLMIPHATRPQLTALLSVGKEYAEASLVCGASRLRTFLKVELAFVRSGIAVAIALVIVLLFHEFSASLMVASASTRTVGTLLYSYYSGGTYPNVAVLALLMVAVTTLGVTMALFVGGSKALRS